MLREEESLSLQNDVCRNKQRDPPLRGGSRASGHLLLISEVLQAVRGDVVTLVLGERYRKDVERWLAEIAEDGVEV